MLRPQSTKVMSELMVNLDGLMRANMSGGEQGLLNPCEPATLFISTHLRETARRALNKNNTHTSEPPIDWLAYSDTVSTPHPAC